MPELIVVERGGPIATVVLNRPEKQFGSGTPDECATFIKNGLTKYERLVKELNVRAN